MYCLRNLSKLQPGTFLLNFLFSIVYSFYRLGFASALVWLFVCAMFVLCIVWIYCLHLLHCWYHTQSISYIALFLINSLQQYEFFNCKISACRNLCFPLIFCWLKLHHCCYVTTKALHLILHLVCIAPSFAPCFALYLVPYSMYLTLCTSIPSCLCDFMPLHLCAFVPLHHCTAQSYNQYSRYFYITQMPVYWLYWPCY